MRQALVDRLSPSSLGPTAIIGSIMNAKPLVLALAFQSCVSLVWALEDSLLRHSVC